jgi:hypothetical protein
VQTHLKQNYVDIEDLETFMEVNFHGSKYKWTVSSSVGFFLKEKVGD